MENLHQRMEALILLRKELHKTLRSLEKLQTSKESFLFRKQAPDEITEIGGAELLLSTNLKKGKTVLFRCELDALPIEEINSFEHRSSSMSFP
jgi:metal-dependent amidase/aminoacylase/carboxypeptidase family protein